MNRKDGADSTTASAAATQPSQLPHNSPLLVRKLSMSLHPRHHSILGIILVVLGSFAFSCMFLFVKLLPTNTFVLGFYRALVEIPIALTACFLAEEHPLGPASKRSWLCVRGGMGALAVLCFFYAIQHLPLPDAVTLQFTTPPFAAAFAVCLVGEAWNLLDKIGAVVCLLGVMLIAHPSWLFGEEEAVTAATVAGDVDAMIATDATTITSSATTADSTEATLAILIDVLGAAFAGLAYMSVRKIGHDASANVMVLYYSVCSIPATIVGSKLFMDSWNVFGEDFTIFQWCLVVLTGVAAYLGQYLVNLGLQLENAATATLATCSQIVFTYIFELLFLHEGINLWSVLGTILIIGFMMVVGVYKMKQQEQYPGHLQQDSDVVAGEPEELALLFKAEHENYQSDEERQATSNNTTKGRS